VGTGRRNRCDDGPFACTKLILNCCDLGQVPVVAWEALREANSTFKLDLDINVDHVTPETFTNLATSLRGFKNSCSSTGFWDWLCLSTDDTQMHPCQADDLPTLSRAKALVVMLGHTLGCSTPECASMAPAAGVVYLTLLEIDGAAQFWGTLFQPVIFHQLFRILIVPLSREGSRSSASGTSGSRILMEGSRILIRPASDEGEESGVANGVEAEEILGKVEGNLTNISSEEARALLEILVDFLRQPDIQRQWQNSPEVVSMVVARLGQLLSRPVDEGVASVAAKSLCALVAGAADVGANELRRTATAVLRVSLPGVLMLPHTVYGSGMQQYVVVAFAQQVRLIALRLVTETIESHPELLAVGSRSEAGMDDPVLAALQLMCVQCPDRAEFRSAAAESFAIVLVAAARSNTDGSKTFVKRTVASLEGLLSCDRASWRGIAAEAATAALLRSDELTAEGDGVLRAQLDTRLLAVLVQRCQDMASTVRARALGGVATAMLSLTNYPEGLEVLKNILLAKEQHPRIDLGRLFEEATMDEKAIPRRAGLVFFDTSVQVLRSLKIEGRSIASFFNLDAITRLAGDESVLVRKSAISSLSLLLRECPSGKLPSMWVNHVLPLALDPEAGVAEKAFADIDTLFLGPLSTYWAEGDSMERVNVLLQAIQKDPEMIEYLKRVLACLVRRQQGTSLQSLTTSLLHLAKKAFAWPVTEWPVVLWSMLEELAAIKSPKLVSPRAACDIIFEAWLILDASSGELSTVRVSIRAQIFNILAHVGSLLPGEKQGQLEQCLMVKLESLAMEAEETRPALTALTELGSSRMSSGANVTRWRAVLARSLDERISCLKITTADADVTVCRCLLTFGELVLNDADIAYSVSASTVAVLQAIACNTVQHEGSLVAIDPTIRGNAFVALGNLCLQREELAKKTVELFVLHLNAREVFIVRNNVLIILMDLCARYTSLVDRFVACMTDLLRDPHELLRKQSVMVLASLLSEDYIKFKGSIVHRFLYLLSDPSADITKLVECVFMRILHPRNAAIFANTFLDGVCGLNGWAGHPEFQSAVSNKDFTLLKAPRRRAAVYRFMLSAMTNEQKFSVCNQMVTSFLAPFTDAETPIDLPRAVGSPGGQALHDVLTLLVCKEMRICFSPKQATQEDEIEQSGAPANQIGAEAAQTALAGMFKRVMCEHVVPVLVQLKHVMEAQRSPFLGSLRRCLCEVLKDFKEDLEEILPNDPQLAGEIAFDFAKSGEIGEKPLSSQSVSLGEVENSEIQLSSQQIVPTAVATKEKALPPMGSARKRVCKAALKNAARAAGKRRSLGSELASMSRESVASPASTRKQCHSRAPRRPQATLVATPEAAATKAKRRLASSKTTTEPEVKKVCVGTSVNAQPSSSAASKTCLVQAGGTPIALKEQVPTPLSARSSNGGKGLLSMLSNLRSMS
jgi:condensin-2 complex subunit D3